MSEKNTITLVFVAVIGAIGAILAACIGLIPTVLPMVRPTTTSMVFNTETFTPSYTPLPDTPSATLAPPTEEPTLTATLEPFTTPSETSTNVPTPASSSSNIDDYVGTWMNVDTEPASDKVKLVVTRIEVAKVDATTANVEVCRNLLDDEGEISVLPNPAPATLYDFAMVARNFTIPRYADLNWTILVQQSGEQIVATVQEYDINNILLNADTFRLEKPSLLNTIVQQPCDNPPATATP